MNLAELDGIQTVSLTLFGCGALLTVAGIFIIGILIHQRDKERNQ